jgi:hypothetical protein
MPTSIEPHALHFQAIAFEAALVDMELVDSIERKRGVAFWACDLLRFRNIRCLYRGRYGQSFGHHPLCYSVVVLVKNGKRNCLTRI